MEEFYDYSQHSYCITLGFDQERVYLDCFHSDYKEESSGHFMLAVEASILYNVSSGDYWFRKDDTIKRKKDQDIFYLENIFTQLGDIYLKKKRDPSYEYNMHDDVVISAIGYFVQKQVNHYQLHKMGAEDTSGLLPHFVLFLPADWDEEIREELIRPIFIQTNILTKNDHQGRLLFFTQLEPTFRYIQSKSSSANERMNIKIKNGQEYVLYGLKFTDEKLSVNLDLFSAQYPSTKSIDNSFVTKPLNSSFFIISFGTKIKSGLKTCLEKRGFDLKEPKTRKIITLLTNQYKKQEFTSIKDGYETENIHEYQPFSRLNIDNKQYELNEKERICILSITMEDIHCNLFNLLESTFSQNINSLLAPYEIKARTGIVALLGINVYLARRFDYKYGGYVSWMVFNWLKLFLNKNDRPSLATFGVSSNRSFRFFYNIAMNGKKILIKEAVQMSVKYMPPLIVHASRIEYYNRPATSLFEHSKPDHIINIVISAKEIKYACSTIGSEGCVEKTVDYGECDIQSLDNFFIRSGVHEHPVFLTSNRMREFMEINFKEFLLDNSKGEPYSKKSLNSTRIEIKQSLWCEMVELFSNPKEKSKFRNSRMFLRPEKYSRLFLLLYLSYLDKLVTNQLTRRLGFELTKKNVGSVIIVDKMLDNIIGFKGKFKELIIESGVFQGDTNRKSVLLTQGEGLLPVIQKKVGLNLAIKSYYVLAQLHTDYIQITLNQVVKITSPKEDAAAIIIQDKIISTRNIYKTLSEYLWRHIEASDQTDYCTLHNKKNGFLGLFSFDNYNHILDTIKQHVTKILLSNSKSLIMDDKTKINFGERCNCSVDISIRDIINIGLKPAIQDITAIIAASLTNTQLFGNYEVNFVFVVGNIFGFTTTSIMYTMYTKILQEAYDNSVAIKGKDAIGYIVKENIFQLSLPVENERPLMFDSFTIGNIYQAAKDTYGVYVSGFAEEASLSYDPLLYDVDINGIIGGSVIDTKSPTIIVLQKGQHIPSTGLIKYLDMVFRKSEDYKYGDNRDLVLNLVRLRNLDDTPMEEHIRLEDYSYDKVASLVVCCDARIFVSPIRLEIKFIHHSSSLQFSLRMIGDADEYQDLEKCTLMQEQLSVAYF